ncbi:selenide, water dikinase SelD [Thioalkalivibrio sp. HK1]|uniref:selenide, water dikinase SelD n=1 Tax=Thioalkalivibrio sp. HK1 TaxID=1469245 RepID=UPI0004B1F46E|nr:selenide, water dikinase SelD [Thioalkalivibrio sp. HK1]
MSLWPSPPPIFKDLVLIGGGHAHVIVLRRLGMKPIPGLRITLISPDSQTPYSGMLPGFVAGHYGYDDIHIDLGPLTRFADARFFRDEAIGLDLERRLVQCRNRPPVRFDLLSIDIGSAPCLHDTPGAAPASGKEPAVIPVKPIGEFVSRWHALVERALTRKRPMRIGVVGAGVGGVEMVLAMQHGLRKRLEAVGDDPSRFRFDLFAGESGLLPRASAKVQDIFAGVLAKRGVHLHSGHRVERVSRYVNAHSLTDSAEIDLPREHPADLESADIDDPSRSIDASERSLRDPKAVRAAFEKPLPCILHLAGGEKHVLDEVLWITQADSQNWLAACGLATNERGFVAVHPSLESISHPGIFAAGDCASVSMHPREKAGVFAVRQGPELEGNLRRVLYGRPPRGFTPQRNYLSLISTGDRYAIATRGGLPTLRGAWVWGWKDWIDRRFMRRFSDLPEMIKASPAPMAVAKDESGSSRLSDAMRCGGCAAKVGRDSLARAIGGIEPSMGDDVLIGLDAPDDAAVLDIPPGMLVVRSVDFFRAMIDDPYVFGRIAANHGLNDIYAMGAEAQSALAIATLPYGPDARIEDTLASMMIGAGEVLREAGASLVGGHSGEGAELALGFSIDGLVLACDLLRKGPIGPRERLVLTKPLGTGVLLAADMRAKAKGAWLAGASSMMQRSNRRAMHLLREYGASACTDVSGFGLLGHLTEMVRASQVDVEVELAALPVLAGALDCFAAGIKSTLHPQNLESALSTCDIAEDLPRNPRWPLLFDPQTAGGLLASLPEAKADECVERLRDAGYEDAVVIGQSREGIKGSGRVRPI